MSVATRTRVEFEGASVAEIAAEMEAWLAANRPIGRVDEPRTDDGGSDGVQRCWRRFLETRDAQALRIYQAFEAAPEGELTLAELERATGLANLGAKLGGQTLSAQAQLGAPAFLVVGPHRYRLNRAVWPVT